MGQAKCDERPRFGEALRTLRVAKGLSLRALAAHLGVSHVYLHDVETCRKGAIARERWPLITSALGVGAETLETWLTWEVCPCCGGRRPLR